MSGEDLPLQPVADLPLESPLRSLLARVFGRLAAGVRNTLRGVLRLFRQEVDGRIAGEFCPAYVATMEDEGAPVPEVTARRAWALVADVLGWQEFPFSELVAMGFKGRELQPGERYGRGVCMDPDAFEALRRVAADTGLSARQRRDVGGEGWVPLPDQGAPARAVPGRREAGGKAARGRCPFHDDATPSASFWRDAGPSSTGAGTCFVCERNGRPLTFSLRRSPNGTWMARIAGDVRGRTAARGANPQQTAANNVGSMGMAAHQAPPRGDGVGSGDQAPEEHPLTATYDYIGADTFGVMTGWTRKQNATAVATIHPIYRRQNGGYRRGDVVDVLQRADVVSQWPSRVKAADEAFYAGKIMVDRHLFTSDMSATRKEVQARGRTFSVVDRFTVRSQSAVMFDLDESTEATAPVYERDEEMLVEEVARLGMEDPELLDRWAVVRTSSGRYQVWFVLARTRWGDVGRWWQHPEVQAWYRWVGARLVAALGGKVLLDASAAAPGRLGRLPAWRRTKSGALERSALVASR